MDVDALTDEEKARVLRRHLVSREERDDSATRRPSATAETLSEGRPTLAAAAVHFPSDLSIGSADGDETPRHAAQLDEESEFPVPYSTPGGDITFVLAKCVVQTVV